MSMLKRLYQGRRAGVVLLASVALGVLVSAAALTPSGTSLAAPATCTTVSCVIQFGDNAIALRDTALNTLQSKVNAQLSAGHISSSQAGDLISDINSNLGALATTKSQLDGETTIKAARVDVHAIYYTYRIFAVVLPRDYHELWLDIEVTVDNKMRAAQPKIENAIDAVSKLPDKNGDIEKINMAYANYKNELQAAEGQIDGAQGLIPTLTPSAFDTALSTYQTNHTDYVNDIKTAHGDLRNAAQDLHTMAQLFKDIIGAPAGNQAAPAATATGTSTGA
jgi:hypothetical protein